MPINILHSLLHRVEAGWDPISSAHAQCYARIASNGDPELIDRLEAMLGSLKGKSVLDLGGGPGQYSVLFAQRGASVTWHDVSREYERISRGRAEASGVALNFSIGYLESANKFRRNSFDLVFCRNCWWYCRSDRRFARLCYSLVKSGGVGYIDSLTPAYAKPKGFRRLQNWLNVKFCWKIGHPMAPHGRIAALIQKFPLEHLEVDYDNECNDVVIFVKARGPSA